MNEPRSRDGPRRLALAVEAVDVLPTDLDRLLVRVAGAWEPGARRAEGPTELVIAVGDEEERRFPALPETSGAAAKAAPEPEAFRATFSVPEALGPELEGKLRLAIGDAAAELPPARLPGEAAAASPGATVIDRAVLAERRARRAELAEDAHARRAHDAEHALRELESELAKLEVRLEQAMTERAALEARAAERQREARAATQREYAERRRREEASEEASSQVGEAEEAARDARARLGEAEARATSLSVEAEALRRRAAEAEHALAGAEAARGRAERLAAPAPRAEPSHARAPRLAAPGSAFPGSHASLPVMRAEAALARRAFSAAGGGAASPPPSGSGSGGGAGRGGWGGGSGGEPSPGDDDRLERALRAIAETERGVRAAAEAVGRSVTQLAEEREAQRRLGQELQREREVQRQLLAALEEEREARDRLAAELAGERDARARAERESVAEREARRQMERRFGALVEELRRELGAVRAQAAGRADEPDLRQFVATAAEALREAEVRIAEAQSAAAELSGRIEQLEGQLLVERAARTQAQAAEAKPAAPLPAKPARKPARRVAPVRPWVPAALRRLLDRDAGAAAALMLDLVAGQAVNVARPLDYRLVVEGEEPRSVSLRPGEATIERLAGDDTAAAGAFQLKTDPRGLFDLLTQGGSRKLRRRVKVSGTWRRRRALRRVPRAELRPGQLAAAEVWIDPLLLLTGLAQLVEPRWTAGHDFVVAHEVTGPRPRRLWVRAQDGQPLSVLAAAPPEPAAAVTAQSTVSAFQRFLGGEPNGPERWTIRGDVDALAVLVGWLERARVRS